MQSNSVPRSIVQMIQTSFFLQDELHWNSHHLEKKLSGAIGLLSNVRHYASKYLLRTYFLFNSHLIYACALWGQNQNTTLFKEFQAYKD